MSQELAVREAQPLALTKEHLDIIKRTVCHGMTDPEFQTCIVAAQRAALNPLAREIYFWKDKRGRLTIHVGINGLRLIAERSGEYMGMDGPEWKAAGGQWQETWDSPQPPHAARVIVYRYAHRPMKAIVLFAEFAQLEKDTWQKMPAHMLGVRAEAHALTKAFRAETTGLRVDYDSEDDEPFMVNPDGPRSLPQNSWLWKYAEDHGWDDDMRHAVATEILGRDVTTWADLTKAEAHRLRTVIEQRQDSSGPEDQEAVAPAVARTTPDEISEPEAEPAAAVLGDTAPDSPPSEMDPQGEASGSEPLGNFPFLGGKYPGKDCAWVAQNDPIYLSSILDQLEPKNRPIAEAWLDAVAGEG